MNNDIEQFWEWVEQNVVSCKDTGNVGSDSRWSVLLCTGYVFGPTLQETLYNAFKTKE